MHMHQSIVAQSSVHLSLTPIATPIACRWQMSLPDRIMAGKINEFETGSDV